MILARRVDTPTPTQNQNQTFKSTNNLALNEELYGKGVMAEGRRDLIFKFYYDLRNYEVF